MAVRIRLRIGGHLVDKTVLRTASWASRVGRLGQRLERGDLGP